MKKLLITVTVIMGLLCLNVNPLLSQCVPDRTDVNTLSETDQQDLRNLILDYLESNQDLGQTGILQYPIVADHVVNFGAKHSYDEYFAIWHRAYIQGLEEYILSQGATQFLPLPYYDPGNMVPNPFFNYLGSDGLYSQLPGFGVLNNQNPNIDFSQYHANLDCSDWTDVDDFVGIMEANHHDPTHGAIGGALGPATTAPTTSIFWLFHAYITDLHACYKRECDGETSDIYVRDDVNGDGTEPSTAPALYVSPDIWVRNDNDGFSNYTSEHLCFKENSDGDIKPVYVYVRTWNAGTVPSVNGDGSIDVYWAQASAGLSWPAPWDGIPLASACGLPGGGHVGNQPLRTVNPPYLDLYDVDLDGDNTETIHGYTIYEFEWLPPNPDDYIACFGSGLAHNHFCIHARIDDGTPLNLSGSFGTTLRNNNDLALRNIGLYADSDGDPICDDIIWMIVDDCIFFGNYTEALMENVGLQINFPTEEDQHLLEVADIRLTLKGGAAQRWLEGGKKGEGIQYYQDEEDIVIRLLTNNAFVGGLTMEPMEIERLCMELTALPGIPGFEAPLTFDIVQTNKGEVVGGERYIVRRLGKEKGNGKSDMEDNIQTESLLYTIYPNPATNQINIRLNNWKDNHDIQILNSVGQQVASYSNAVGVKSISTEGLGKGIFFVTIENKVNGDVINKKVVVD